MKIQNKEVKALFITEIKSLDPITVFLEDFTPGAGRITIVCYGKAWTSFWPGTGARSISEFFCSCDEHYIAKNLSDINSTVTDWDAISKKINSSVEENTAYMYQDEFENEYGPDWRMGLPSTSNHHYEYLCRIIKQVQKALKEQ